MGKGQLLGTRAWIGERAHVKLDVSIFRAHEKGNRLLERGDSLAGLLDCSAVVHSVVSVPISFTYKPCGRVSPAVEVTRAANKSLTL